MVVVVVVVVVVGVLYYFCFISIFCLFDYSVHFFFYCWNIITLFVSVYFFFVFFVFFLLDPLAF